MRQLLGPRRGAVGSDVMSAALEGHALLKVTGTDSGPEDLRRDTSVRFARSPPPIKVPADAT